MLRALGQRARSSLSREVLTYLHIGAAEDMAHSSLRFGIGRFTTEAEIDFVIEKIVATVQRLRDMSPLWEMVQEGIDINTINWAQH